MNPIYIILYVKRGIVSLLPLSLFIRRVFKHHNVNVAIRISIVCTLIDLGAG